MVERKLMNHATLADDKTVPDVSIWRAPGRESQHPSLFTKRETRVPYCNTIPLRHVGTMDRPLPSETRPIDRKPLHHDAVLIASSRIALITGCARSPPTGRERTRRI